MNSRIISMALILPMVAVISTGMYIYNSSKSSINDSISQMEEVEIENFNKEFSAYEGKQTGSQVKSLLSRLITNANTYEDDLDKIPSLKIIDKINAEEAEVEDATNPTTTDEIEEYVSNLGKIRASVESKHTYNIELKYSLDGYINEIDLIYED